MSISMPKHLALSASFLLPAVASILSIATLAPAPALANCDPIKDPNCPPKLIEKAKVCQGCPIKSQQSWRENPNPTDSIYREKIRTNIDPQILQQQLPSKAPVKR
jgi:hypothetical protein